MCLPREIIHEGFPAVCWLTQMLLECEREEAARKMAESSWLGCYRVHMSSLAFDQIWHVLKCLLLGKCYIFFFIKHSMHWKQRQKQNWICASTGAVSHGCHARLQDAFAAAQKSLEQRLDQYRFSYEALAARWFGDGEDYWCWMTDTAMMFTGGQQWSWWSWWFFMVLVIVKIGSTDSIFPWLK